MIAVLKIVIINKTVLIEHSQDPLVFARFYREIGTFQSWKLSKQVFEYFSKNPFSASLFFIACLLKPVLAYSNYLIFNTISVYVSRSASVRIFR